VEKQVADYLETLFSYKGKEDSLRAEVERLKKRLAGCVCENARRRMAKEV
jgi:hypothetical protein